MGDMLTWITVIAAALISLLAVLYVVRPLTEPGRAPLVMEDDRLTLLLERKDSALTAIKELEFDYQVGKISDEDYQRFDQRLRRQAIGLLQQIEKLAPESAMLDEQLEAQIVRLRRVHAPEQGREGATVTAMSGNGHAAAPMRFCTGCGQPVADAHKFCAHCGTPVAAVPESVLELDPAVEKSSAAS